MSRGINLDVLNPAGDPEPTQLLAHGFTTVRLVSKPDPNGPGVHPHIEQRLLQYKQVGIRALIVITNESLGRVPANHHGICQAGNEPDGQPPSSMVMSKDDYVEFFNTYSEAHPDITWICAGLCSGDPQWWFDIMPRLNNCQGVAVHLYRNPLDQAEALLAQYAGANGAMPVYVTEWNPLGAWPLPAYDWALRSRTQDAFFFCWSDAMVSPFGLFDKNGSAKASLMAFNSIGVPAPQPQPAPLLLRQWHSSNFWSGRPYGSPIALVLHTEAGSEAATEAWFTNNASQVSAHFGVGLGGRNDQFVQLGDSAWANGIREAGNGWDAHGLPNVNPNYLTVSIETEDAGDAKQVVTDQQYASVLADARLALRSYPSIKWLLRHADISPQSRAHCPGDRWTVSGRFARLAHDLGLSVLG